MNAAFAADRQKWLRKHRPIGRVAAGILAEREPAFEKCAVKLLRRS
jgi:hypothetical protein